MKKYDSPVVTGQWTQVSVFCLVLLNGLSRGRGAPVAQPQLLTGLAAGLTTALGTASSGAAFLGG
jgi:hypothetical protein